MCGFWFPPLKHWVLISKMLISKVPITLSSPEFRFCFVLVVLANLVSSHHEHSFYTGTAGFLHLQSECLSWDHIYKPCCLLHLPSSRVGTFSHGRLHEAFEVAALNFSTPPPLFHVVTPFSIILSLKHIIIWHVTCFILQVLWYGLKIQCWHLKLKKNNF